jgi:RNA polymerase sigma-70 factor, ECF subfamily
MPRQSRRTASTPMMTAQMSNTPRIPQSSTVLSLDPNVEIAKFFTAAGVWLIDTVPTASTGALAGAASTAAISCAVPRATSAVTMPTMAPLLAGAVRRAGGAGRPDWAGRRACEEVTPVFVPATRPDCGRPAAGQAGTRLSDEYEYVNGRAGSHPDSWQPPGPGGSAGPATMEAALAAVARGDDAAFAMVYDRAAPVVLGVARRILRDPAQSEEVMQEVLLEVWRTASRFDPAAGSAEAWITMLAHRRAVDRVRSEQRAAQREVRAATATVAYDEVADTVEASLDRERVRRCLAGLTELQRESVTLAYYGGYTYREVAHLLGVAVGTVKTRMRDGLIRLRDCLGVG